jgi:hypothetical protein
MRRDLRAMRQESGHPLQRELKSSHIAQNFRGDFLLSAGTALRRWRTTTIDQPGRARGSRPALHQPGPARNTYRRNRPNFTR